MPVVQTAVPFWCYVTPLTPQKPNLLTSILNESSFILDIFIKNRSQEGIINMNWAFRLLETFILGNPAELPTLQSALTALNEGGPLRIAEHNLMRGIRPRPGGERYEVAKRVENDRLSVIYFRSRSNGVMQESFDLLIRDKTRGGILVYFTDGEVVKWKCRDIPKRPMDTAQNYAAQQILIATRETCGINLH